MFTIKTWWLEDKHLAEMSLQPVKDYSGTSLGSRSNRLLY